MDTTDYNDWSQSAMVELSVAKGLFRGYMFCSFLFEHKCHKTHLSEDLRGSVLGNVGVRVRVKAVLAVRPPHKCRVRVRVIEF